MTCYIERRVREKRKGRGRDESEDITADRQRGHDDTQEESG